MAVLKAASVRFSSSHELFLPDSFPVDHSLDGCSAATHFALMRARVVIAVKPRVQIGLQRVDAVVELFAERNLIELLQYRLVEPLADAVGLGRQLSDHIGTTTSHYFTHRDFPSYRMRRISRGGTNLCSKTG